ncbi:MAG: hypothetical protein ACI8XO_003261 [Verrucomicrobiales bacterium]|jgi:hypothetical protein
MRDSRSLQIGSTWWIGLIMKIILSLFTLLVISSQLFADDDAARLKELNAYWAGVSRAVGTGDFAGYVATCHDEGVLVSGKRRTSYPLAKALTGWKKEFDQTKAGKMKAGVEFRFAQRFGDGETAHETGMFLYSSTDAEGVVTSAYIHFEALLVKRDGDWKILMEYQKSEGAKEDWEKLAKLD